MRALLLTAAIALTLSACVTMENGSSQDIGVITIGTTSASCTLSNKSGRWTVVTPGTARVSRSSSDLEIDCVKPGFQEIRMSVHPQREIGHTGAKDPSWLDLPGAAIDAASGAYYSYPDPIRVAMTPQ